MPYKDPEKNKECKERYRQAHLPEEKIRLKKLYQENKEEIKARSANYYKNNKAAVSKAAKAYKKRRRAYVMWVSARYRARKIGVECNICEADIIIPTHCPVLGIPLFEGENNWHKNSPSLDRIDPSRGYTKDNICVISWRANNLKRDGNLYEFEQIIKYIKGEL